jgi:hypothetical protein
MNALHARFLLAVVGDRLSLSRALGFPLEYWRTLKTTIFDSYRPERHNMRGPGPKCRAKRGTA